MTSTTTTTTTTTPATWDRCACEHNGHRTFSDCTDTNICQCRGEVRYGYGDTWSISKQVDESIECSNEVFGDPLYLQAKECQCKQATYHFVDSSNCGQGLEIVSAQACKAAADTLGITYNKESMRGRWTHTPPGCFVHKGCTHGCRLHFGIGNGSNDGKYRALCNVAQGTATTATTTPPTWPRRRRATTTTSTTTTTTTATTTSPTWPRRRRATTTTSTTTTTTTCTTTITTTTTPCTTTT